MLPTPLLYHWRATPRQVKLVSAGSDNPVGRYISLRVLGEIAAERLQPGPAPIRRQRHEPPSVVGSVTAVPGA